MKPSNTLFLVLTLAAAAPARAQVCPPGATERRIVICRAEVPMADCLAAAKNVGCAVVRRLPLIHAVVVEVAASRFFSAEAVVESPVNVERVDSDRKVRWLQDLPDSGLELAQAGELTRGMKGLQTQFAAPPASPAAAPRIPWGVARVGAPEAWPRTQGAGASVAVIDTGIDATHPDLAGQVAGGVNILDPQHPDNWKDDEGHGTHVSGTIAAKGGPGGLAGVAPRAKLYAVKVLDKDGNGSYSDVIAGIEWAMNHGIKIANMSLGAEEDSEPLHRAVQAALAQGMIIVAAAGNNSGAVGYPGAYPETIAVAASDSADKAAAFSSRGPQVAFIAPGVDIESTKLGGGYTKMSGTSMASPHVSGLAALAYAEGATTPAELRAALESAARPITGLAPDVEGRGMVLAGNLTGGFPSANGALAMLR